MILTYSLLNLRLVDNRFEISNLDSYLDKSIEISQNIHKYWQLSTLEEKRKIQKMVFPEGIVVDTTNRTYLASKVNSLFLAKSQFQRTSGGTNKKLPINSDEESSLVDKRFEISNLDLVKGLKEVVDILEHIEHSKLFF